MMRTVRTKTVLVRLALAGGLFATTAFSPPADATESTGGQDRPQITTHGTHATGRS